MRVVTLIYLVVMVTVAVPARCCEGANLRHLPLTEDEEEFRPQLYKDYSIIRNRNARSDNSFDDYGHLRFGRSDK